MHKRTWIDWGRRYWVGMFDVLLIGLWAWRSLLDLRHVETMNHLLWSEVLDASFVEGDYWVICISNWKVRFIVRSQFFNIFVHELHSIITIQSLMIENKHIIGAFNSWQSPSKISLCGRRFQLPILIYFIFTNIVIWHVWLVKYWVNWWIMKRHISLNRLVFLLEDEVLIKFIRIAFRIKSKILIKLRFLFSIWIMNRWLAKRSFSVHLPCYIPIKVNF